MSETLVLGQGNFGSIDGDPAASMRYTECRMTAAAAIEMLDDLDKDTVDFQPNYDESRVEPKVLPGRFPHLHHQRRRSGIAVAMASSIPPHNPNGGRRRPSMATLDNPEITDRPTCIEHIPGPDLPTQAPASAAETRSYEAYTHRDAASSRCAAGCEITESAEEGARGHRRSTAIPYQVNKTTLLKKMADARQERPHSRASRRSATSPRKRHPRGGASLKRGEDPDVVVNQIYKFTPLRDSLSVIMIALVDGRPELCSLKRLIEEYIRHRKVVITRRTQLPAAQGRGARSPRCKGLIKALDLIDEIVKP